jgi:hypothetical protein
MQQVIDNEVTKAVDATFARVTSKVDASRVNEIKIEIGKQAVEIVADVARGTRISISLESQQKIELWSRPWVPATKRTFVLKLRIRERLRRGLMGSVCFRRSNLLASNQGSERRVRFATRGVPGAVATAFGTQLDGWRSISPSLRSWRVAQH